MQTSHRLITALIAVFIALSAGSAIAEDWGFDSLDLASGAYSGDLSRLYTSAGLIWYQYVSSGNPATTAQTYCKFNDNGSWAKQWGAYSGAGIPNLNPAPAAHTDWVDAGGSAWGAADPDNMLITCEDGKTYVFNVVNDDDIIGGPGDNVCALVILEVNHQNALATLGAGSESRTDNTIRLSTGSTAEDSGSNEELWYQWTSDGFSTKQFVEDTDIAANDYLDIALNATSGPKEGQTLSWLAITTVGLDSNTVDDVISGNLLLFDAYPIKKIFVRNYAITDDDSAPVLSGFTASATDGQIKDGGYTISGSIQDTGSGVNENGTTVSGDDFSPNYDILNANGDPIVVDQVFTTRPADGEGKTSAASLSVSAAAAGTGAGAVSTVDLGTYTIRVSCTDADEDPSTLSNDRKAAVNSQVATFTVADDDSAGPVIDNVSAAGSVLYNEAITVTCDINDAVETADASTAVLYYGYAAPYNAFSVTPQSGSGDGAYTFVIPAQTSHGGDTLKFSIACADNDADRAGDASTTTENNGGSYYAVLIATTGDLGTMVQLY